MPSRWWIRLLARLTGRTETQVAWRLRQGSPHDPGDDDAPAWQRGFSGAWSLLADSLPDGVKQAPATWAFGFVCVAWYLFGVLRTGHVAAFSGPELRALGATHGFWIALGQWWRVLSANVVHHDLVHIAFDLYALALAGRLCEALHGGPRTFAVAVLGGVAGMSVSFAWYTYVEHVPFVTSGGASASVAALIGFALVAGHRTGTAQGRAIRDAMVRWTVLIAVWGFVVPGINNAAHAGGYAAGLAAGWTLSPVRRPRAAARLVSLLCGLALVGSLVAAATTGWSYGSRAWAGAPRAIFGKLVGGSPDWPRNDATVRKLERACEIGEGRDALDACLELAFAAPLELAGAWQVAADRARKLGDEERAREFERAYETARRLIESLGA